MAELPSGIWCLAFLGLCTPKPVRSSCIYQLFVPSCCNLTSLARSLHYLVLFNKLTCGRLKRNLIRSSCWRCRRASTLCLSAGAVPPPAARPSPGPGSYNLPSSFDNVGKMDAASSAFLSTSERCTTTHSDMPGPGKLTATCPCTRSPVDPQRHVRPW